MKAGFILSQQALSDLDQIHGQTPAGKIIDELINCFRSLEKNPGMGTRKKDATKRNIRFWVHKNFIVAYLPDKKPVEIVRVLNSYGDIANELKNDIVK